MFWVFHANVSVISLLNSVLTVSMRLSVLQVCLGYLAGCPLSCDDVSVQPNKVGGIRSAGRCAG